MFESKTYLSINVNRFYDETECFMDLSKLYLHNYLKHALDVLNNSYQLQIKYF